jgi:O-antigen/teichoic acid export membrane protein
MKINILVNLISKLWTGLIGFLIVPMYLHILGSEQYGLVGVYVAMLPIIFLVDGGLAASLNRSFAQLSIRHDSGDLMRDTLRTMEYVYWGLALLIVLLICSCAPLIAHYGVHAKHLSRAEIGNAIILMGLSTATLFPFGLYQGGFMGLQRQAHFNAILVIAQTIRVFGVLPIMHRFGSTIAVFFLWQILVTMIQNIAAAVLLWKLIPLGERKPSPALDILKSGRSFTFGVFGINVLTTIVTQIDRPIMLALLPVSEVGYYSLAAVAGASVTNLVLPVYSAAFPKFSELVAHDDQIRLRGSFHSAAAAMAVLVIPVCTILAGVPNAVLMAWSAQVIHHHGLAEIIGLIAIGWSIGGLVSVPTAMQLANGWTSLTAKFNIAAVICQIPLLLILIPRYGGLGAASVWVGIAVVNVIVVPNLMFNKLMKDSRVTWYVREVILPIAASCGAMMVMRWIVPAPHDRLEAIGYLALIYMICLSCTALSLGELRRKVFNTIFKDRVCPQTDDCEG